jgi:hypothetical protein
MMTTAFEPAFAGGVESIAKDIAAAAPNKAQTASRITATQAPPGHEIFSFAGIIPDFSRFHARAQVS